MIDMHSHCLPGIDDGARNTEQSLLMLSDSFKQGVTLCAATPHLILHKEEDLDKFLKNRDEALQNLKAEMKKCEYPEIILGAEVYLDNDINKYKGLEQVCYTNTEWMLLEFPMDSVNPRWAEWIYELNRKGIKILIAHVDRYPYWEQMMSEFGGLDVKYQVNASRFIKFSDRGLLKNLFAMRKDYIVSSDMHNMRSRKCNMEEAYLKAKKKFPALADEFFAENAEKILGK